MFGARASRLFSIAAVCSVASSGCTRAAAASLLPALQVGLAAQRIRNDVASDRATHQQQWSAALFVTLRFQPQVGASQLPLRPELIDDTWSSPCDVDDTSCLRDTLTLDPELAQTLGDQQ